VGIVELAVGPARRKLVSFCSSLGLHVIPVAAGLLRFDPGLELPEIELEFAEVEMIDPDLLQSAEPPVAAEPEPAPVPVAPTPPETTDDPGGEPEPPPPPKPRFGDKGSAVDGLGPANATLFALLVTERVRRLPYADLGVEIMAPLPDFQFLIQGGGFDTLHDFDYLVIATPDVRDATQTFLAVEYRLSPEEMRAGVERAVAAAGQTITWETRQGRLMGNPRPADPARPDVDPRWVVSLDDDVAVFVREEFLPAILTGPDADERKTAGNFVANLTRLRRFAAREPKAAFQAVVRDLHRAVRRAKFFCALPNDLEILAEAAKAPDLVVRSSFASDADAESCEVFWKERLATILEENWQARLAAGWIYRLVEVQRDGAHLTLRAHFSEDQATTVLQTLAGFSAKILGKSPEEMEADRRAREERWRARRSGKLPPSAGLGPTATEGAAPRTGEPTPTPTPTTPPEPTPPEPALPEPVPPPA
jgi:hypothetical protein